MFERVRTTLHRAITTPTGDGFLPVRLPKDLARRLNMTLGEPLCSAAELDRRRQAKLRLDALRSGKAAPTSGTAPQAAAPVMIYFEKDRNTRLLGRIQEALDAKRIAYTLLDVAGDDATKRFVMREAQCKDDELPIVFVAGAPVGGYNELVEWDVSGRLAKALYGDASSTSKPS